jgi:hypothetical protein
LVYKNEYIAQSSDIHRTNQKDSIILGYFGIHRAKNGYFDMFHVLATEPFVSVVNIIDRCLKSRTFAVEEKRISVENCVCVFNHPSQMDLGIIYLAHFNQELVRLHSHKQKPQRPVLKSSSAPNIRKCKLRTYLGTMFRP